MYIKVIVYLNSITEFKTLKILLGWNSLSKTKKNLNVYMHTSSSISHAYPGINYATDSDQLLLSRSNKIINCLSFSFYSYEEKNKNKNKKTKLSISHKI